MKKILILRFSSMGDIVLTSPVVRCLHQELHAEIHYLTKAAFGDILHSNPYIHKVWTFDKEPDQLFAELREQRFDYIIDLHHNLRSLKVKLAMRVKAFAFPKLTIQRWLLVHTKLNLMPKTHIVHRYMEAVRPLGVQYDGQGLDYFIPEQTEIPETLLPKGLQYEAMAIGAAHFTKRLPLEKMIGIIQARKMPVVLLGGKQEIEAAVTITKACGQKVINLCGLLTLHQSALIARDASLVLTHDTGMMHIAAALRKPIMSFWGSTVLDFGFYPFYPDGQNLNTSIEVKGLSCRPCTKFGRSACPKGHFKCMQDIDITLTFPNTNNHSNTPI